MDFLLYSAIGKFRVKKPECWANDFPSYKKMSGKINIAATTVPLGLPKYAPNKSKEFQTLLRKARSSSRWALAKEIMQGKLSAANTILYPILSWKANPMDDIAQNATWYDLNQGHEKSGSYFWRKEDIWKTSALGKRKKPFSTKLLAVGEPFGASHNSSGAARSH